MKVLLILYILQELFFIKCFYKITKDFINDLIVSFVSKEKLYSAFLGLINEFLFLGMILIFVYILLLIPIINYIFSILYECSIKNPFFKKK